MKIGEVVVGKEYAAHDSPAERHSRTLPRQVKVLEIVVEEEKVYGRYSSAVTTAKKRRVKVEVLGLPEGRPSNWHRDKIKNAEKGATLVIEARMLVALWSEVRTEVAKKVETEQKRVALQDALEARLDALKLGEHRGHISVSEGRLDNASLSVYGTVGVEKLLALAEAGMAAQS